jgi:hypothetical protein
MKDLKQEAISHYDKMITWAKKQKHDKGVVKGEMLSDIGEHWGGDFCEYCTEFVCSKCPLSKEQHFPPRLVCCDSLWGKMTRAKTWRDWIYFAEKIREYIILEG